MADADSLTYDETIKAVLRLLNQRVTVSASGAEEDDAGTVMYATGLLSDGWPGPEVMATNLAEGEDITIFKLLAAADDPNGPGMASFFIDPDTFSHASVQNDRVTIRARDTILTVEPALFGH